MSLDDLSFRRPLCSEEESLPLDELEDFLLMDLCLAQSKLSKGINISTCVAPPTHKTKCPPGLPAAKVLKFRLTYKKDLEAVLGPEPPTNAANLAAFGLLQGNYCPGQGGESCSHFSRFDLFGILDFASRLNVLC